MNKKQLLVPVLIRYLFFLINFYFTVRILSLDGWGFFPIVLAAFATRDFVQATQFLKIYFHLNQIDKE